MKKTVLLTTVVSMVALSMLACSIPTDIASRRTVRGSGNVAEEERTIDNVTGVQLAMQGTLHIELGASASLYIEAEDNLLEHIETRVRGRTLIIETSDGVSLDTTEPIHYYLTVTDLDEIDISSSGDVEAPDLEADRFSVTITSSGDLTLGDLVCDVLDVDITSSGDMTLGVLEAERVEVKLSSSGGLNIGGGEVDRQVIDINSSGNYAAQNLASAEADVTISSSGDATVRVSDRLDANLSSSGNVYLIGNPTVHETSSSSGSVTRLEE
jgi:hypothetical protein